MATVLGYHLLFAMLIAPLMFFYVLLLTSPGQKLQPATGLLTLPFFVFLIYFMVTYYFLPVDQKVAYYREATSNPWTMIYAAEFFLIFSGPFYAVFSLVRLRKHSRNIGSAFSYTEGISLKWLKGVFSLVLVVNAIMILSNILSDIIPVFTYQTADNIVHATNVLKENKIGAINWGLVDGKTNTKYAWGDLVEEGSEPELWFHEIFRKDGIPYKASEADMIRQLSDVAVSNP